jgi:hypothetical protein
VKQLLAYPLLLRVKQVIAIAFIIGKIISFKVWIADRTFPVLPFFDFLSTVSSFIHSGLLIASIVLLIINIIKPSKNIWLVLFLIVECCSILLDETRLQAWVYEYLLLLFPFVFLTEDRNETQVIVSLKLILIATYFWSGFYKWNSGFLFTVWRPVSGVSVDSYWLKTGYVIPLLEMLFAIGLMFGKTRKTGALGIITMHVFILIIFGPFGMNYNISVWPWNLCMIIVLGLLFLKEDVSDTALVSKKLSWQFFVLLLCIMPVGNVSGVWKDELSFKLYSGNGSFLYICVPENEWKKVPEKLNNEGIYVSFCEGRMLSIKTWTMQEMNVMPCNNEHYSQKLRESFLTYRFKGSGIHFWIHESPYDSSSIHEWK